MQPYSIIDALVRNVMGVVKGKPEQVRLALACVLADGHLLLDDVPGTGKTTLAKAIAGSISGGWKRVQFTPDLLPSDITGVMVFDQGEGKFHFRPGPVFTNVMIGDEINRASPKTQAALLEVMEERQVTADGQSRPIPRPFFVIATQNPLDSQGTFPLPDVQLDRFMIKMSLGYADPEVETRLLIEPKLNRHSVVVEPVVTTGDIEQLSGWIEQFEVSEPVARYVVELASATRRHPDLRIGVSTRATMSMVRLTRSLAAMDNRNFVTPDDVKYAVGPVFGHRLQLTPEAELRGVLAESVLAEIVDEVPVPRSRTAV